MTSVLKGVFDVVSDPCQSSRVNDQCVEGCVEVCVRYGK